MGTRKVRLRIRGTQRLEDAHEERLSRGEVRSCCSLPAAAAQHALVSQHLRRLSAAPKQVRECGSNLARLHAFRKVSQPAGSFCCERETVGGLLPRHPARCTDGPNPNS